MWAAGLVILLLVTSAATAVWASRSRRSTAPPVWNIPAVVANYTQISSTLAALALASAVFIATLGRDAPAFEDSIGLFIYSFLLLVAASMQFAATPGVHTGDEAEVRNQHFGYVTANSSFYLGITISWLGLRLLLLAIRLDQLADIVTWVLLFSIILGTLRLCMHLYRHTTVSGANCFAIPSLAILYAVVYWYGLAELWSDLLPSDNQPLQIGVLSLVIAGAGYGFQTMLLAFQGSPRWESYSSRFGEEFFAGFVQSAATTVIFLWLTIAES